MEGKTFSVPREESFTLIVAEDVIDVYERYEDAVQGLSDSIAEDSDCFIAEVSIAAENGDDVSVTLEQVAWQQIIRDMVMANGN